MEGLVTRDSNETTTTIPISTPTSIWICRLESTGSVFQSFGLDKDEAEKVMVRATKKHCRQQGVDWSRFFLAYWSGVEFQELTVGEAWSLKIGPTMEDEGLGTRLWTAEDEAQLGAETPARYVGPL